MEFLDEVRITALKKALKRGTALCPLFAVEQDNVAIVTNSSWLMEWPRQLVDTECKAWARLIADQDHKKAKVTAGSLLAHPDWRSRVFRERGTFVDIQEGEPGGDTPADMIVVLHNKLICFHYANFDAVELCIPGAKLKLYQISKRIMADPVGKVLAVYDGRYRVGAFMNTLV